MVSKSYKWRMQCEFLNGLEKVNMRRGLYKMDGIEGWYIRQEDRKKIVFMFLMNELRFIA